MAHIVASITVFVNAPPLYLLRRYAIANARIAPMLCSFAARMAANRSVFLHLHVLPPIRGFAHLIRNKARLLIEQIQANGVSNQICS